MNGCRIPAPAPWASTRQAFAPAGLCQRPVTVSPGRLLESDLEQGLIDHLKAFLLELGKGFAFVARQMRVSTETRDFYIDLVFYNYLLKCFVIFDLKPGECMMVAAHSGDLAAAAAAGLHTAHIARPDEKGKGRGEQAPSVDVDFAAKDIGDLSWALTQGGNPEPH